MSETAWLGQNGEVYRIRKDMIQIKTRKLSRPDCEGLKDHGKKFAFTPSASHTWSKSSQDFTQVRITSIRSYPLEFIYLLRHFHNIDSFFPFFHIILILDFSLSCSRVKTN